MTQEQQILNQLAKLLHTYSMYNYDAAYLEYEHAEDGSWNSFSSWYVIDGKNVSSPRFSELKFKAELLCKQLYETMRLQNNWCKLELSLIDGKTKVKFNYI